MDNDLADRHVLEWEPAHVHKWFSSIGFPQYESQLKDNNVDGEALVLLNPETLKELGVPTIGQRLAILKAIYQLKNENNLPIDEDQYIPPSEAPERLENLTLEKLSSVVQEQASRLRSLEDDNRQLNQLLSSFAEDVHNIKSSLSQPDETGGLRRQPSFKWAQFVKPQKSPTKPDSIESPHPSPQRPEHEVPYIRSNTASSSSTAVQSISSTADKQRQTTPQVTPPTDSPNPNQLLKTQRQESTDNLKSFKVSLEDPTWKVLPAALKKYRINNDTWKNYAMFICYGSSGNRIERCLSYDEKPLLLFQKLKDSKKNPVFMLKHIKDIRSPIAVAQQKQAARKASSVISNDGTIATQGHHKTPSTSKISHRPPRLEVSDLSTSSGPLSTTLTQPGWPEPGLSSPLAEQKGDDSATTPTPSTSRTTASTSSDGTLTVPSTNGGRPDVRMSEHQHGSHTPGVIPLPNGSVSYAVAIYPYMAEQEDEFDVVVGDTFVILSRSRGWWIVQRDPTGSGVVDTDIVKQGWVPAGCLLETNVPVASAIAAAKGGSGTADPAKTPILPLSIISTSFPGVALMDYKKKGEEELDLIEGEQLRVFKRYNHWSYAVKEQGGDRGWVPSWFIGKVSAHSGNTPNTPASGTAHNPGSLPSHFDDVTQSQVSPMSSAFPPVQPARS